MVWWDCPVNYSSMDLSSFFGLTKIFNHQLKNDAMADSKGGNGRSPLSIWAWSSGEAAPHAGWCQYRFQGLKWLDPLWWWKCSIKNIHYFVHARFLFPCMHTNKVFYVLFRFVFGWITGPGYYISNWPKTQGIGFGIAVQHMYLVNNSDVIPSYVPFAQCCQIFPTQRQKCQVSGIGVTDAAASAKVWRVKGHPSVVSQAVFYRITRNCHAWFN